jgi:hypothetical protein
MPECENEEGKPPEVMVVIKCATVEDFEELKGLLEEHIFKTNTLFMGVATRGNIKTTWYPLKNYWSGKDVEFQEAEE